MRRIKLMILISTYGVGGFETRLERIVRTIDKKLFDVVILLVYPYYKAHLVPEKIKSQLIEFLSLTGNDVETVVITMKSRFDWFVIKRVAQSMKDHEVNALFFFALGAGTFIAPVAGKLAKVFPIIRASGTITKGLYPNALRILDRILTSMTDLIIVPSEFLKNRILKDLKIKSSKVRVIPNGTDLDKFQQNVNINIQKQELGIERNAKVVGILANLIPVKAHTVLIHAIPTILEQFPKTHFLLIGEGYLKEELANLCSRLDVSSQVQFLGYRSDVEKLIPVFDIGILCSKVETFGNALIEIMAAEKPVVATDVGAISEIVQHGVNGLLVPSGNSAALSKAIIKILGNPKLASQYGKRGRQRVLEQFSKEKMVLAIQEQILN